MDKIWDRKSFEVGGHWPLWRDEKNERPRRTDNRRTVKKSIWEGWTLPQHGPYCIPVLGGYTTSVFDNSPMQWYSKHGSDYSSYFSPSTQLLYILSKSYPDFKTVL